MSARDDLRERLAETAAEAFDEWMFRMHGVQSSCRHEVEGDGIADALLPVVEEAVTAARIEALTDAGQEAYERGDIGKPGGVEAWVWLPARAAALAEEPRS